MPRLACWSCGRTIFSTAAADAIFPEERRCPRCGAQLNDDRRQGERRSGPRRKGAADETPAGVEQKRGTSDRRQGPRRTLGNG